MDIKLSPSAICLVGQLDGIQPKKMFQVTSKVAFWGNQPNPDYYFAKKDSPRKNEKQTNKYRAVIIRQQDKINDENDWLKR